jgi:hypothetical protein
MFRLDSGLVLVEVDEWKVVSLQEFITTQRLGGIVSYSIVYFWRKNINYSRLLLSDFSINHRVVPTPARHGSEPCGCGFCGELPGNVGEYQGPWTPMLDFSMAKKLCMRV